MRTICAAAILVLWSTPLGFQSQARPPRPRILGIAHVRLLTSDLQNARRFYGSLLGYPEVPQSNASVAVFRVNERQRFIVRAGLPPERDDRFLDLAFETDDLRTAQAALAAGGFDARSAPDAAEDGGTAVDVRDVDGHALRVIQLSAAPLRLDDPDRRISRRILHAGLTIRDAGAADRFYRDTLGFSEIWRGGRPEGTTSWINMRVPDGTDYLEYMLFQAPPTRQQLGSAHHAALLVGDIQTALELVRARTAPDDRNHRAVPQIGVNRRWQLNIYDPDGTRIEFMEPWTAR